MPQFTDFATPLECGCSLKDGRCGRHASMMRAIHAAWFDSGTVVQADEIWALSDGYGEPGYVPEQGYDWSGIRDSSTEAIEAMFDVVSR